MKNLTSSALLSNGSALTPAQLDKRYETCVKALNFEVEQFWKRSLFFWVLIGTALIALAVTEENRHSLQAAIASFGFAASLIWTLANRGSKFRYEDWEDKLIEVEEEITGPLHGSRPEQKPWEGRKEGLLDTVGRELWSGKRYSASKLAIALSDYVVIFWFGLLAYKVTGVLHSLHEFGWHPFPLKQCLAIAFIVVSAVFAVFVEWSCRLTKEDDRHIPCPRLRTNEVVATSVFSDGPHNL
jgi:hypothetical protein